MNATAHIRRPLRALAVSGVALALTASPAAAGSPACANQDVQPTAANTAEVRSATLCLLNRERGRRGQRRLAMNTHLTGAAQRHADDMVARNFFSHVSPGGTTMLSRVRGATDYLDGNRGSWSLGENLAWGSGDRATPRQTLAAWMASPGHRRNILNRSFRHVGVGVALGAPNAQQSGQPAATYTTNFGQRR